MGQLRDRVERSDLVAEPRPLSTWRLRLWCRLALAPAIAGLDAWYVEAQLHKFRSGGRGQHIDDVAGMRMRPMSLTLRSDEDIAAVSAYVASLPPQSAEPVVVGDAARGQTLYTPCGACHGVDGTGNQVMNGPRLDRASDWYLLESLEKFRAGVRGTSPKDPTGAIMRTMAMTLADEQALKDVVAHIMTLGE